MKPVRLQLFRRKGFNLQSHSRELNGLEAVKVSRPGKHGNPFRVGIDGTALECVEAFRHDLNVVCGAALTGMGVRTRIAKLRGKNLACWCKPGAPCHGDVLLELANVESSDAQPQME